MAPRVTIPTPRLLVSEHAAPRQRLQSILILILIVLISAASTALLIWSDAPF